MNTNPEVPALRIPDFPWLTEVTPGRLAAISTSRQAGKSLITSVAEVIKEEARGMLRSLPQSSKALRLVDLHRTVSEADIKRTIVWMALEEMGKTPNNETDETTFEALDTSAIIGAIRRQIKYFEREDIPLLYYLPSALTKNAENYPRRGSLSEPTPRYNNLVAVIRHMHNLVRERTSPLKGSYFLVERLVLDDSPVTPEKYGVSYQPRDIEIEPPPSLDYEKITNESVGNLQALERSLSEMLPRTTPAKVVDFCTNKLRNMFQWGEAQKEALEHGRQRFHQLYNAAQQDLSQST